MISIRRIYSTAMPRDRDRVAQVKAIFLQHFQPTVDGYPEVISDLLDHPVKFGYRGVLLVAEQEQAVVAGFALVLHFAELSSSLLDYIVVARGVRGGGVGSALYEAVREHCRSAGSRGLYMESMPDDPAVVKDPAVLEENIARLRFYEPYGVRPVIGTKYERPPGGERAWPYLLFDGLGRKDPLSRKEARAAARVILERKYGHLMGRDYIDKIIKSFMDDPVQLREPRYVREPARPRAVAQGRMEKAFGLVVTTEHEIHHVRDRGYVERPARVDVLEESVLGMDLFVRIQPRHYGEDAIRAVHDGDFVTYLKTVCEKLNPDNPVYPCVFPIRNPHRKPRELAVRAGYYCIDTFTPLDHNAYLAARHSVDAAMTSAEDLLEGRRVAYALCRPPGHHAERRVFGGFCYFNNAAVAAHRLSREGRVAILDIDFHHGNGTQDIFYRRSDVLTVSIHGHPNYSYPYFSGFADETGEGDGLGFNLNFPLPEGTGEAVYLAAMEKGVRRIERFDPTFVVVSLGLDTLRDDPTGEFALMPATLAKIGQRLGGLGLPLLIVQEGGYILRNLKRGIASFFTGVADALADKA